MAAPTLTQPSSMRDLREMLIDTAKGIRDKSITPAAGNAMANVLGKVVTSVKVELDYYRAVGRTPEIEMMADTLVPEKAAS